MAKSLALRRYNRAIIGLSLAYAGALIGANMVFKGNVPSGLLAYLVAVLPALPIIGMFVAIGRYLNEEQDEYVRVLAVRKTLIASASGSESGRSGCRASSGNMRRPARKLSRRAPTTTTSRRSSSRKCRCPAARSRPRRRGCRSAHDMIG